MESYSIMYLKKFSPKTNKWFIMTNQGKRKQEVRGKVIEKFNTEIEHDKDWIETKNHINSFKACF